MKAVLTTPINIEKVTAVAEMAWLERRPELGLVCRAARHGGGLTAAAVQSVLPGLGDAGARNVVGWCVTLGLCDSQGGLTRLGEDAAESDQAPVPEQGVYRLWLVDHPLTGRRILHVERQGAGQDRQRFDDIQPLPIHPDSAVTFQSVVDGRQRFIFRTFPGNHAQPGCVRESSGSKCQMRWVLDFEQESTSWQLEGDLDSGSRGALQPSEHKAEQVDIDLWGELESWAHGPLDPHGRWHAAERRLAVPLEALKETEQDSFRKTLKLQHVDVRGKGHWQNLTLSDVSIGPQSTRDAERWALSRLKRDLRKKPGYRSRAELRERYAMLGEGTPLEPFAPTLPDHAALLGELRDDPGMFWSLAAPVDLAPHPVPREELQPLRIGVAEAAIATYGNTVRMPYRSGWAMQELMDRLLVGNRPQRVLLCDRYVRGKDNLTMLQLLVESVRGRYPDIRIDVWTDEAEADFRQIQSITGRPPRTYHEIFGRARQGQPHDRFLLVAPDSGPGFGWQMSNSPLHARTDSADASPTTCLRWKELLAYRLAAEQLQEQFKHWLAGGGQ
ncbi:hypothetical protein E5198_02525 [Pseudomonas sp. A-1]|jgi:hypothetical protein|uniref:hypothetical protein n=1 Tax=Pseudomonas sp. A-1 TaxID=1821274 RepID=UPI0010A68BD3|nr:hypothetical protein [Pseudomonas sp. A-1]THG86060.1 hypothetical protein E5198_02525 [Pseudomonas sp. A-1]